MKVQALALALAGRDPEDDVKVKVGGEPGVLDVVGLEYVGSYLKREGEVLLLTEPKP